MFIELKRILVIHLFLLLLTPWAIASDSIPLKDIEPVTEWTEYALMDGVRIEYKYQRCDDADVKNQVLILFRYTNLTDATIELSWKTKIFMNNECINCHRLENDEYAFHLQLLPNEVKAGDGTSKRDKRMYIFSNYINLAPGMSGKKLTDFEIIELNIIQVNQ
ncbi:MAG: hypothetical protein QNK23_02980 [Crocinitomicaceae bacterium]|nr:hypothetical protein [Crocinitomicaceae bacterium]